MADNETGVQLDLNFSDALETPRRAEEQGVTDQIVMHDDVDRDALGKAIERGDSPDPLLDVIEDPRQPDLFDRRDNLDNLVKDNPDLAGYLKDPVNAAVSGDDVENLSAFQKVANFAGDNLMTAAGLSAAAVSGGALSGLFVRSNLHENTVERATLITKGIATGIPANFVAGRLASEAREFGRLVEFGEVMNERGWEPMTRQEVFDTFGLDPKKTEDAVVASVMEGWSKSFTNEDLQRELTSRALRVNEDEEMLGEYQALLTSYIQSMPPGATPSEDGFVTWALSAGIENAPFLLTVMAAGTIGSLAGPGGTLAATAGTSAALGTGEIAFQAVQEGVDLTDEDFRKRILPGSVLYAATEFIGVAGRYVRPLMSVDDQLIRRATMNWAKTTGKVVAANAAEEFINEFLQEIVIDATVAGEVLMTADAWRKYLWAGLTGAVVGGGVSVFIELPGAISANNEAAEVVSSEAGISGVKELNKTLDNVKTRERSGKKFNEFLQTTKMDRLFVYIDAAAAASLVESGAITAGDLGVRQSQLDDAVARSGRISVKVADYAGKLADKPGVREAFETHGTLDQNGLTQSERDAAEAGNAEIAERIASMEAEFTALAEKRAAIQKDVYLKLRQSGQSHKFALTGAQLHAAFFTTMEQVYGRPVVADFPLEIVGPPMLVEPSFTNSAPLVPTAPTIPGPQTATALLPEPSMADADVILPTLLSATEAPAGAPQGLTEPVQTDQFDVSSAVAPTQPEVKATLRSFEQSSVGLIANPPPVVPADGKRVKVKDVAQKLTDLHTEAHGRALDPIHNPDDDAIVRDSLREELDLALQGMETGEGWYSQDTDAAITETARLRPEVQTPDGRAAWLMLAGILSNGQPPSQAWAGADLPFRYFLQEGRFPITRAEAHEALGEEVVMSAGKDNDGNPLNKPASWSRRGAAVSQGMAVLNTLLEREGSAVGAADWLAGAHTPAEINALMLESGLKTPRFKTKASLETGEQPGYLALGPKLGPYFNTLFQIESGQTGEPVIDVWLTRTYRRLVGGLLEGPLDTATGIVSRPSPAQQGAERAYISRLTSDLAVEYGLPVEDVQAILWFYEQRLYTALGVKSENGTNSNAARLLTEAHGLEPADVGSNDGADTGSAGQAQSEDAGAGDTTAAGAEPVVESTPEDLSKPLTADDLQNLDENFFRRDGWATLTADLSSLPDAIRAEKNLQRKEELRADLEARDIPYVEVTGHYGTPEPENSFVILADEETAVELGTKYGQDSVLTPSGLVYTTRVRPDTPTTGDFLVGQEAIDSEFYSITSTGQAFSVDLDFDRGPGKAVMPPGFIEGRDRPQLPVSNGDGFARLYHWSDAPLDSVDPEFAGTGPLKGPERRGGHKATFWGIAPRENPREPGTGYVKEPGLGDVQHVAKVDPARLYPWFEDPDGLRPTWTRKEGTNAYLTPEGSMVTESALQEAYERAIRDAGYLGYYTTEDGSGRAPLGNVAKLFEAVPVKVAKEHSYKQSGRLDLPQNTILDEDTNEPVLWYRGSDSEREMFDRSFWSNKQALALEHAFRLRTAKPRVTQATLAMENPLTVGPTDVEPDIYWLQNSQKLEDARVAGGHDGILIYDREGVAMAKAFSADQVTERQRFFNQPAWHGSPHIFDKFSIAAIGTGEGALAFGWGLYFAGARGIGEFYRSKLTQRKHERILSIPAGDEHVVIGSASEIEKAASALLEAHAVSGDEGALTFDGAPISKRSLMATLAALLERSELDLTPEKSDLLITAAIAKGWLQTMDLGRAASSELVASPMVDEAEIVASIELLRAAGVSQGKRKAGRLYKVSIPDNENLMIWDAPFSEQPAPVQAILSEIWMETVGFAEVDYRDAVDGTIDMLAYASDPMFWTDQLRFGMKGRTTDNPLFMEMFEELIKNFTPRARALHDALMDNRYATLSDGLADEITELWTDLERLKAVTLQDGSKLISGFHVDSLTGLLDDLLLHSAAQASGELAPISPRTTGQDLYSLFSDHFGGKEATSKLLRDRGIAGHRFLDANSRQNPKNPTYNYVIYDDATIEIVEFFQNRPTEEVFGRFSYTAPFDVGTKSTIELFTNANPTTFAHESGHFFLEVFTALAQTETAPEAAVADLQGIHAWMLEQDGVDAVFEEAGGYTEAAQEAWARAFEVYLKTTEAPSAFLQRTFRRMTRWLLHWYRGAEEMNVEIAPEIRDIMSRMLATETELATAKNDLADQALFNTPPPEMTKDEWEAYRRLAEDTDNEALERLNKKRAKRAASRRKEVTKRVKDEVAEEFANDPVLNWVRDENAPKINKAQLVERLGSEAALGDFKGAYAEDGGDIRAIAEMLGFDGVQAMLDAVEAALISADLGEAYVVSARVEAELAKAGAEDLVKDEVNRAVKSASSQERVAREAAAMSKAAGKKGGAANWQRQNAIAKRKAEETIAGLTVKEIMNPSQFLKDSKRAAREAQKLLTKVVKNSRSSRGGNLDVMEQVAEAKRRQLLSDHVFRRASELATRIERFRAHALKLGQAKTRAKIGEPEILAIDYQLERLDFRKAVTQREVAAGLSLAEYRSILEEQNTLGELAAIDPRLEMDSRRLHYTELTGDEVQNVMDLVTNIEHLGRQKTKAKDEANAASLASTVNHLVDLIGKNVKGKPVARESGRRSGTHRTIRQSVLWVLNAGSTMQEIDGGKLFDFAHKAIKQAVDEGSATNQERRETAMRQLFDIYTAHYSVADIKRMKSDVRAYPELGNEELSHLGLIAMALNSGNAGNWQRLTNTETKNGAYPEDGVRDVLLRELTENDWRFVVDVWEYIDQFWPEISAQELRLTGVRPKKVTAEMQFEGAPSFVKGGYFPIAYDRDLSSMSDAQKRSEDSMDGFAGRSGKAQTANGHVEARLRSVSEPLDLDLGIIERHVQGVIYDLSLREPLINAWKIVTSKPFQDAMLAKGRGQDTEALELWLQDTAAGDRTTAYGWEVPLRYLRNTFTASRLGLNLRTALIQPLGIAQSAVLLGKKNTLHGMNLYRRSPRQWIEYAMENSAVMRQRQLIMERDMNQITGQLHTGSVTKGHFRRSVDAAVPWLMMLMQKSQFYVTDMPTWVAAYEMKLKDGATEKAAIKFADASVNRAQGSGLISDRGMIERGTVGRSIRRAELPKLFTVLSSFFFARFNVAAGRINQARMSAAEANKAMNVIRLVSDLFILYAADAAVMALIGMDWDDDEDAIASYLKKFGKEIGSGVLSTIPIVKDAASVAFGFDGGVYDAYLQMVPDAQRVVTDLAGEAGAGEGEFDLQTLTSLVNMGSLLFLPSSQINRVLRGIFEDDFEIKDTPPLRKATDAAGLTRAPR